MRFDRAVLGGLSIVVAAATCLPALYLVWRALEASPQAWDLFLHTRTALLLANTVGLAVAVTALCAALALPLAWLVTRTDMPARQGMGVLLCLPLGLPSFVNGYVLLAAFGDGGLCTVWGLPRPNVYGFSGALLALALSSYPYLFLSFRAALLRPDASLLEAARGLGCTPWGAFRRVTLPQLWEPMRAGGLLVAFYALSDFGAVSLLQYETFSRAIYTQLEGSFDRSLAALWSLGLMAMSMTALALSVLLPGRAPAARLGRGALRIPPPMRLGLLRWPAVAVGAAVVAAGIGLPLGVMAVWVYRAHGDPLPSLVEPAWNSVLAAGLAALATPAFTLPLALLSARRASSGVRALERAAYATYCLPPVVMALSLVSFGIRVAPWLYGTLAMLIFAHVVRFAPQALGPTKGAFQRVSPALWEAGLSLGRRPFEVAARVTLPLIRPGLAAGAALVFLTAIKELPATLLLAPIGFATLATRIWSATAEGQFGEGALSALALVFASSLCVAWMLRHEAVRAGAG